MKECFYSNCPVPNAFILAIKVFEQELADRGVHFSLLPSSNSSTHFAGDLDAYFRLGGEIPPLMTQGLRAPGSITLIGLTRLRGMQGLFVKTDSQISNPADLKGKRVAMAYNARMLLDGFDRGEHLAMNPWDQTMGGLGMWELRCIQNTLALAGLTTDDVELVEVKNPWSITLAEAESATTHSPRDLFKNTSTAEGNPQVAALLSGEVDAMFSFLPYAAELAQRGEARIVRNLVPRTEDDYMSTFGVSTPLVKNHPEVVQAVMDVTLMAAKWAAEHPYETAEIHAENLRVSPESFWIAYGPKYHKHLTPSLGPKDTATLNQTIDFLIDHKVLDQAVDVAAWSDDRFLNHSLSAVA